MGIAVRSEVMAGWLMSQGRLDQSVLLREELMGTKKCQLVRNDLN
jgi:hypothetical protein